MRCMANELSLSISATQTKNGVTYAKNFSGLLITVTGDTPVSQIASIGTSDETLSLGDISSLGYIVLKNLDATNYIEVGYVSGTYFGKLKAGETCALRAGAGLTAIHVKANTAPCLLDSLIFPN